MSTAGIAGIAGIAKLVLGNAEKLVDEKRIKDVAYYQLATTLSNYVTGNWKEISEYDESLFNVSVQQGLFITAAAYTCWHGLTKANSGEFHEAGKILEDITVMCEKYQFGGFVPHLLDTELPLICRKLYHALTQADGFLGFAIEKGSETFEMKAAGLRAVAQVLVKDSAGAKHSLAHVEQLRGKQALWPPFLISSSLLAEFMLDLHLLEDAIGGDSRFSISEYSRAALKSGKAAVKNSAKFAAHRTWNYQLMGKYYWLIGKQRKALKWFDKSIKEGERLGARPDLSRTVHGSW